MSEPITAEELQRWREAAPPPALLATWKAEIARGEQLTLVACRRLVADAEAAARLLDEVERLRAENAKLKTEIGEWCRAASALDYGDEDAERRARIALTDLRTGNGFSKTPPSVVERAVQRAEAAEAELGRLRKIESRLNKLRDGLRDNYEPLAALVGKREVAAKLTEILGS